MNALRGNRKWSTERSAHFSVERSRSSSTFLFELFSQILNLLGRMSATRLDALRLYRDILRTARGFTWADKDGKPWRQKLMHEARKEFDDKRNVESREEILKLIFVGQDALFKAQNMVREKRQELLKREEKEGRLKEKGT